MAVGTFGVSALHSLSTVYIKQYDSPKLITNNRVSIIRRSTDLVYNAELYLILNEVDECVDVRVSVVGIVISNGTGYAIFDQISLCVCVWGGGGGGGGGSV